MRLGDAQQQQQLPRLVLERGGVALTHYAQHCVQEDEPDGSGPCLLRVHLLSCPDLSSAAAETALAQQPEVLINRICLQFQRLFDCRDLEGVLPAMNKLYLAHTGGACRGGCNDEGSDQRLAALQVWKLPLPTMAAGPAGFSAASWPEQCASAAACVVPAEAQTFLASLRTALGLDPAATLEACANRLEQLLADK